MQSASSDDAVSSADVSGSQSLGNIGADGFPAHGPTQHYTLEDIFQNAQRTEGNADYSDLWTSETIKYAFLNPKDGTESAFTEAQKAAAREAFGHFSDIANIRFQEVPDTLGRPGDNGPRMIGLVNSTATSSGNTNYDFENGHLDGALIRISRGYASGSFDYGTNERRTLTHEIAHAMVMPHPNDYPSNATWEANAGYSQDSHQYTILSYFRGEKTGAQHFDYVDGVTGVYNPSTPLLHDIYIMQRKYGANMTTRTGDTTYGFNSTADRGAFDFTLNPKPIVAIWDAGGNDTIDLSGFKTASLLNLEAAVFSDVGGLKGNLVIAYNATIENGIGGAGNDTINGSAIGNMLDGGGADDILSGLDGADNLRGNIGHDLLEGGTGNDTLSGGRDNDLLRGGDGNDIVNGDDGDDTLVGGAGDDTMNGGAGRDTVSFETATAAIRAELGALGSTGTVVGSPDADVGIGNDKLVGIEGILGSSFNDTLIGGTGDDILNGAGGNDTMRGGAGNDTYTIDTKLDVVEEANGAGTDTVLTSLDGMVLGSNLENLRLLGTGNLNASGNNLANQMTGTDGTNWLRGAGGNDVISGLAGNDSLDGGLGNDYMVGGLGNDHYWVDANGDTTSEADKGGVDTVHATISVTLRANVENLILEGTGALRGDGNALENAMTGTAGANRLRGFDGNDTLQALDGNDTLLGGNGDDTLRGGNGADLIDGEFGADEMVGGAGDDVYYINDFYDRTIELANGGRDILYSTFTTTLGDHIEVLRLMGTEGLSGFGNVLANQISGTSGHNKLFGYAGNDILAGLAGNDSIDGGTGDDYMSGDTGNDQYWVDSNRDVVVEKADSGYDIIYASVSYTMGANIEELQLQGSGNLMVDGNAGANIVFGTAGTNRLRGYDGNDNLQGLGGNDTLFGGGGTDTLTGGDGNDVLDGGTGLDYMTGGAGSDLYYVDDAGERINEAADAGIDVVEATVGMTLGENIEKLRLKGNGDLNGEGNGLDNDISGTAGHNRLRGHGGNDILAGNAGNDTLDGGTGDDYMSGGTGDDSYWVDSAGDGVAEKDGGGHDIVNAAVSFALSATVEDLTLTGTADLTGDGNEMANVITAQAGSNLLRGFGGNDVMLGFGGDDTMAGGAGDDTLTGHDGNDIIDGGTGADSMVGAAGDDLYYVDNVLDVVVEGSLGFDTIESTVSYTLGLNIERLSLQGGGHIDGTGNVQNNDISGTSGNNLLTGFAGNDVLSGLAGNDTLDGGFGEDDMAGGEGNDVYYVNTLADTTVEQEDAGIDSIYSTIGLALRDNVENLYLDVNGGSINGEGNGLNNEIVGTAAANRLWGYDGNDVLSGLGGQDTLVGGAGSDILDVGVDSFVDRIQVGLALESTGAARDFVRNFDFGTDKFDFDFALPTSLGQSVSAVMTEANFDNDLAAAMRGLAAHAAVLFTPVNDGSAIGSHKFLVVDVNGIAGYQSGEDYVAELIGSTGNLTLGAFV